MYYEAPMLAGMVAAGALPPVAERLPEHPLIVHSAVAGSYGGTLRIGEMTPRFCHYLRHINEAPLLEVGNWERYHHYSRINGPTVPGVLEAFGSDETGCAHQFRIRRGIRWSDGARVTTEDVRYAVEDVLLRPELKVFLTNSEHSEIMMPEWEWLMWGDRPVELSIQDEITFTLRFSSAYPAFVMQQVRSARWQMLLRPAHYLKRFHIRYADPDALAEEMVLAGYSKDAWPEYYQARDPAVREAGYHLPTRIPELWNYPVLDPWVFTPDSDEKLMKLVRNPYYYAVDAGGNQLPYIDRIERRTYPDVEALRKAEQSGETDVAGCFTKITDARQKTGAHTRLELLPLWQVQQVILLINLCPQDERLRPLVQDVRFRQAVSLAIDRDKMRREVFAGYGRASQLTAGINNPVYQPDWEAAYAGYAPSRAAALLSDLGMTEDMKRGAEFQMVYYPVTPMVDEAAARIAEDLAAVGLRLKIVRLKSGTEMGPYQEANRHVFGLWEMAGDDPLIPYQIGGLSDPIPLWWRWYETKGTSGVEPTPEGKRLYALRNQLKTAAADEERLDAAREVFQLQADNLWCIGTVADVPQPILFHGDLENVLTKPPIFLPGILMGARQWFWKA